MLSFSGNGDTIEQLIGSMPEAELGPKMHALIRAAIPCHTVGGSTVDYTHQEPGHEIQSISGTYLSTEELRLQSNGREVLCIIGISIVDAACCGTGMSLYTAIPGYVVTWKDRVSDAGLAVSVVEPVDDEEAKREIVARLKETKGITNIDFW
jgi:hypothetical protein